MTVPPCEVKLSEAMREAFADIQTGTSLDKLRALLRTKAGTEIIMDAEGLAWLIQIIDTTGDGK